MCQIAYLASVTTRDYFASYHQKFQSGYPDCVVHYIHETMGLDGADCLSAFHPPTHRLVYAAIEFDILFFPRPVPLIRIKWRLAASVGDNKQKGITDIDLGR